MDFCCTKIVKETRKVRVSLQCTELHDSQYLLCTVHTYTNFNTIEYDFAYLENLNNIFINFVVNRS